MTSTALSPSVLTLTFLVIATIRQVSGQCSGSTLVFTATESYQVFTSVNYPFNYDNNQNCIWRIEAANATDAIRLEVTDTAIEYHADCVYDYGEVYDGYNVSSTSLGKFCGTSTPTYVSTDRYLTVVFVSDYSLSARGFKAQYKSGDRASLLDPEEDSSNLDAVAILGASIGAVVLLIIIMAVIFTYIQAKKAKEIRRNPHLRRGMSTSRVEPFSYDYGPTDFCGPPPPPRYGDIYSTPVSPPPLYSEVDPNPQHEQQLPGRPLGDTPGSNNTDGACGHTCNISVISTNPANTRFSRSPQPPGVAPIQTSAASQNTTVSIHPPRTTTIRQNNGRPPVSSGTTASNAGATAAMNLLGATPQQAASTLGPRRNRPVTTTRPTGRPGRSLPTVGAAPANPGTVQRTTTATAASRRAGGVTSPRGGAPASSASETVALATGGAVQVGRTPVTNLQRTPSDVSDLSLGRSVSALSVSSDDSSSVSSVSSSISVVPTTNA